MTYCQQNNTANFKDYVVQILNAEGQKSTTFYAVSSLVEAFNKYNCNIIDADFLKLWIASLFMAGIKANTAKRYVGKIHSIFKEWQRAEGEDCFNEIKPIFDQTYQLDVTDVLHNLERVKLLFGKNEASGDWKIVSIFFYLLYNADASLLDVADATFDNAPRYCAQIDEIVKSRDRSNGRKYLFNLKQSQVRPTQIVHELTVGLSSLMQTIGMKFEMAQVRDEITAIWVAAAMKCGIDICDIRAVIPFVPYRYRALMLIPKANLSEERKHEITCQVADYINDNTPRWFVMKLRKGVGLDDIKNKIEKELPGRLSTMELFYPTRIVSRKVGKKIQKEEQPYVPDLLFFRTQYSRVRSLFAKIGDMAWCFKVSNLPDSRYSIISHEEMSNFQQCVGQFTPDIKVELASASRALGKGRMVRITGGVMKGYKGKIEDLNDDKGTRKFFLTISNDSALNWTAEVEDYYIEPL